MSEILPDEKSLKPITYVPGATTLWNNSWRQLYENFGNAILAYSRSRGLNNHSAEDVLQEVMTTLIRCQHGQTAGYDEKAGSFQAWLWGVIRNRVHSVRRKDEKERPTSPPGQTETSVWTSKPPEVAAPPIDISQLEEDEWQRALLAAALRKVQDKVKAENFEIYTALLEEKATIEELGLRYGKKPNAIYAVKHRCEGMLLVEARALREAWQQLR